MSKKLSFEELELTILRQAVDKIGKKKGKKIIDNPEVKDIIEIVEQFLKTKKRICYGGTAINNILPLEDQFYDKSIELPDYDFFSPEPLKDAEKLADIYYKKGFQEVEAKSGVHEGTFKVFVNFLPVADITYSPDILYKKINKESITIDGIKYCSPNFLRMSMYLELSRPDGDVSRWEKVLKRLTLLNNNYPVSGVNCEFEDIQRLFQFGADKKKLIKNYSEKNKEKDLQNIEEQLFHVIRDTLVDNGCVFFGAFANKLYLKQLKSLSRSRIPSIPDFDVLSEQPEQTAKMVKDKLSKMGIKQVKIIKQKGIGEIIAPHYEIRIGKETLMFIYEPLACHSYNVIRFNKRKIRIATIDTMLSFYLAFLFANRVYYDQNRILCMSEYLFKVQQKNRLKQRGLLKRFSIDCYGKQLTIEMMREEKSNKFKELKNNRNSKEYEWWFLRYVPAELNRNKSKKTPKKSVKTTVKRKKKRRNKTRKKSFIQRLFN